MIQCIDQLISQNQIFFVNGSKLNHPEIQGYIKKGWLIVTEDDQTTKVDEQIKQVIPDTKPSKTNKKNGRKRKDSTKTVTKTNKTARTKNITKQNVKTSETPAGMYSHVPEGSDAVAPVRLPRSGELIVDLDIRDIDDGDLSFVDHEQKEARKLPLAEENSEVE